MVHEPQQDWREICKAAAVEQDSERLSALLADLMAALDAQDVQQGSGKPRRAAAVEA